MNYLLLILLLLLQTKMILLLRKSLFIFLFLYLIHSSEKSIGIGDSYGFSNIIDRSHIYIGRDLYSRKNDNLSYVFSFIFLAETKLVLVSRTH